MKILAIIIIFQFLGYNSQTLNNIEEEKSSMTISGTSSLHDWESSVEDFKHTADITVDGKTLSKINQLEFTVVVKSIKSGHNGMDKKTYEALRESDHPEITYNLISAIPANGNTVNTTGELTIAGKKKKVIMEVNYKVFPSAIEFHGELTLKMSDYDISPPTAMMGAIKTGNEVTIRFSLSLQK